MPHGPEMMDSLEPEGSCAAIAGLHDRVREADAVLHV